MKKLIALTFAMLFLSVGIAVASDFSIGGSYYVRGTFNDNVQQIPIVDPNSFGVYDHELSLDLTWKIDDATKVFARIEAQDNNWGTNAINENKGYDPNLVTGAATMDADDNLYLEQIWGAYTFAATGGTLTTGIMSAGAWATAFNDNGDEAYRIKYVQPTAVGTLIGILEKLDAGENGTSALGDANDADNYIIGFVTKAGPVNIRPLFVYGDYNVHGLGDTNVYKFDLGFDGTFGNIGFEAEIVYQDMNYDDGIAAASVLLGVNPADDYSVWGAYVNVWAQLDALKVGGLIAYGSEDDDDLNINHGFDFGDDFEAGGALIMGDDITFANSGNDLTAGFLIAVYADYAINEDLTVGAYLGYARCNIEDNAFGVAANYEDADIWEISVDMAYKITENVTYSIAAGRAELNYDVTGLADPDASYELNHKLNFTF